MDTQPSGGGSAPAAAAESSSTGSSSVVVVAPGLVNEGATGFVNTSLQLLYNLPYFRTAIHRAAANTETAATEVSTSTNLIVALSNVFLLMAQSQRQLDPNSSTGVAHAASSVETSSAPTTDVGGHPGVSTMPLLRAFGWGPAEMNEPQDWQEFWNLLLNAVDEKTQPPGTPSAVAVSGSGLTTRLMGGYQVRRIQEVGGPFSSTTTPSKFFDLALPVHHRSNPHTPQTCAAAIQQMCATERLDGTNRYRMPDGRLVDADMREKFLRLPPVLMISLKRVVMDFDTMRMVKSCAEFQFPQEINLSDVEIGFSRASDDPTVNEPDFGWSNKRGQAEYVLVGVVAHAGPAQGGYHSCYVRSYDVRTATFTPFAEYKDDAVRLVSDDVAVQGTWATPQISAPMVRGGRATCGLMYVRKCDLDTVFSQ
jgi:ubiquitin C-terminal hydrolase